MKTIMVSETGGTLTRNFVMSLRSAPEKFRVIGISSHPYELMLSNADQSFLVPDARDRAFIPVVNALIRQTGAEFLHSSHDTVISVLATHKNEIATQTFLPDLNVVNTCIDKYKSYQAWQAAGLPVPETLEITSPEDLKIAFGRFGRRLWLRAKRGGAGYGSLPADDFEFARRWIANYRGWGQFTASRLLSPDSVTWTSIWKDGHLIVGQGRKRLYWLFANRTISGVTGITGTGETIRDKNVDQLAERAILAVSPKPHGIFSVDLTRGLDNKLCLTEINIGRFFTTIHFFTRAGLNMPYIFCKLAFGEPIPPPGRTMNPLKPGLLWVRGMDTEPVLTDTKKVAEAIQKLETLKRNL